MSASFSKLALSLVLTMAVGASFTRVATAQFPAAFGGGNTNQPNVQQPGNVPGGMPSTGGYPPANQNPMGGQMGGMPQRPPVQVPGQQVPGMPAPSNPVAGTWVVMAGEGMNNFQARLELNPNGQYSLSMNATQDGNSSQLSYSGRWQVQGSMLVFETNGEIEQMPLQFNGQTLVIDIPSEGVRVGFARNPQASFVQPMQSQSQPSNYPAQGGGYGGQNYNPGNGGGYGGQPNYSGYGG